MSEPSPVMPVSNKSKYTCAINYIVQKDKSKLELAQYLHVCAYSPATVTFQESIQRGIFLSWPGIENINFPKILPAPLTTVKETSPTRTLKFAVYKDTD